MENILKYPLSTEKSIRLMESEKKIVFAVDRKTTKKQIKEAMETMFKVKVEKVNVMLSPKGVKKAYIKLNPEFPAIDVATKLGLM